MGSHNYVYVCEFLLSPIRCRAMLTSWIWVLISSCQVYFSIPLEANQEGSLGDLTGITCPQNNVRFIVYRVQNYWPLKLEPPAEFNNSQHSQQHIDEKLSCSPEFALNIGKLRALSELVIPLSLTWIHLPSHFPRMLSKNLPTSNCPVIVIHQVRIQWVTLLWCEHFPFLGNWSLLLNYY